MIAWIAAASCLLAVVPAVLFLRNLPLYAPPPRPGDARLRCSVLIPARNEEANIAAALRSILQEHGDRSSKSSSSTTARPIAPRRSSATLRRVTRACALETAQPLPAGWCGKNFACHQLAALAAHPLLVFMDADVRARVPTALARLAAFMEQSGAALVSGVPGQETRTFSEQADHSAHPFRPARLPPARADANDPRPALRRRGMRPNPRRPPRGVSTHAAATPPSENSARRAVTLPRIFRAAGFATDLFDATDISTAACIDARLRSGTASRKTPTRLSALRGSSSPPRCSCSAGRCSRSVLLVAISRRAASPLRSPVRLLATGAAFLPRLIAVARFRQSVLGALLHPVGICALVAIQWFAFLRSLRRASRRLERPSLLPASRGMKTPSLSLLFLHSLRAPSPRRCKSSPISSSPTRTPSRGPIDFRRQKSP